MTRTNVIEDLRASIDALRSKSALQEKSDSVVNNANKTASASSDALKKIVALVNARDRSEKAIRERLARDEFPENEIDEAVEQAKYYGFIDDTRYAEVLVRSRITQGKGSAGIVRELAENNIDPDTVPGWPFEFPVSHEEEVNRALSLLDRKPPRTKNAREGAYRRLMQKGFPSSVASSAARIWSEQAE